MKKQEEKMLMSCVYGDDKELAEYAKRKLMENGILYELPAALKKRKRIEDHMIYELYHSDDPYLNMKSRELAVRYHKRFLYFVMEQQFSDYIGKHADDLFQCGTVGLLKSLVNYDGSFAISTYSRLYIVHEMTAFVYYLKNIPSPHYAMLYRKVDFAEKSLNTQEIPVTPELIAEISGLSLKSVNKILTIRQMSSAGPLNSYAQNVLDQLSSDEMMENLVVNKIEHEYLFSIIMTLPEEQRHILYLKIFEDYSYDEISKELHIPRSKVYKSYYAGLKYLKQKMQYYV